MPVKFFTTLFLSAVIIYLCFSFTLKATFSTTKNITINSSCDKNDSTEKIYNCKQNKITIATGIGAIQSLAERLTNGTDIEIIPAFPSNELISNQKVLINGNKLNPKLNPAKTTACITLRSCSPDSQVFNYLRSKNIKIIEIDCAAPAEANRRNASLIEFPQGNSFSQNKKYYQNIWLGPSNIMRILDIIAEDLSRIVPENKERISHNLRKTKKEISIIIAKFQKAFSQFNNTDIITLSDDFAYLANDFELFTTDTFTDDGRAWSENKLSALRNSIIDNDVKVIIHKWQPDQSVIAAIKAVNAQLIVLDPVNQTVITDNTLLQILEGNLEKLHKSFTASQ